MARIDELNRTYPDGSYCDLSDRSIRHAAAWEELFAKPEWNEQKAGHRGRCSCCGSSVAMREFVCGGCGAVWHEPNADEKLVRQFIFGIAAITISAAVGYLSGELFVYVASTFDGAGHGESEWSGDFIRFVESYIWISVSIISLLAFTYLYEKTGLAPKGVWVLVTHPDSRTKTDLPDLDCKEGSK